jgi:signal peptidase I
MRRTTAVVGGLAMVAVVAAALAVRRAQLEPMLVKGGSMRPTLGPGQRIAVAPLARPPARGDLVVLRSPRSTGAPPWGSPDPSRSTGAPPWGSPDPSRSTGAPPWGSPDPSGELEVVKRVVGLPGERVRLVAGRLEVDGQSVPEPYLAGPTSSGELDLQLGPAEYLVLGDHRAASTDGRDFGPVGADALVGRVRFAYWPPRRLPRG